MRSSCGSPVRDAAVAYNKLAAKPRIPLLCRAEPLAPGQKSRVGHRRKALVRRCWSICRL
ncbi:hypothetical protein KCP74_12120 [Salmonella enterica subsp. enterica]|nr:hypothetical protein KCP74_12120 [Salmonella enterica subsp. enterica]